MIIMASISIGFFALPTHHLEEIVRLNDQSRDALYNRKDDRMVRENELYRGAAAVALHHAELSGDWEDILGAFATLEGYIHDKAWQGVDQSLFAPDEAKSLAHAVAGLERRARSVTKLVQRIARHRGARESSETCRQVHDAFREALGAATSQGAGFLWATYWPDAEAELAERRARERAGRALARLSRIAGFRGASWRAPSTGASGFARAVTPARGTSRLGGRRRCSQAARARRRASRCHSIPAASSPRPVSQTWRSTQNARDTHESSPATAIQRG